MKIDELIEELEQVKEEHGNLEVEIPDKKHGLDYDWVRDVEKTVSRPNGQYKICQLDT